MGIKFRPEYTPHYLTAKCAVGYTGNAKDPLQNDKKDYWYILPDDVLKWHYREWCMFFLNMVIANYRFPICQKSHQVPEIGN
jgi:hypothetical protein